MFHVVIFLALFLQASTNRMETGTLAMPIQTSEHKFNRIITPGMPQLGNYYIPEREHKFKTPGAIPQLGVKTSYPIIEQKSNIFKTPVTALLGEKTSYDSFPESEHKSNIINTLGTVVAVTPGPIPQRGENTIYELVIPESEHHSNIIKALGTVDATIPQGENTIYEVIPESEHNSNIIKAPDTIPSHGEKKIYQLVPERRHVPNLLNLPDALSQLKEKLRLGLFPETKKQDCEQNNVFKEVDIPKGKIGFEPPKFPTWKEIHDSLAEKVSMAKTQANKVKLDALDPVEKVKPAFYPFLAMALWFAKVINYLDEMITFSSVKDALEKGVNEEYFPSKSST